MHEQTLVLPLSPEAWETTILHMLTQDLDSLLDSVFTHHDDIKINKKRIKAFKRLINYYSVQDVYAKV